MGYNDVKMDLALWDCETDHPDLLNKHPKPWEEMTEEEREVEQKRVDSHLALHWMRAIRKGKQDGDL